MLRGWYLILVASYVLLSFLAELCLGHPRLAAAKSLVVAEFQKDESVCFMQTRDGRTVNLTALCGSQSVPAVSPPKLSAADSEAAKMPLSSVGYDGNSLSGQVTNQTGDTVRNVRVNYEVLDSQGNLIDNGVIYARPSTIPPGGSASFSGITVKGAKVRPTFVEWSPL